MASLDLNTDAIKLSADSWGEQFSEALKFDGEGAVAYFLHALSLPWKLIFSLVPPPQMCDGWLCFLVALAFIGA